MAKAQLKNGLELEYDTFGDKKHPSILLVMGLASQMIAWPEKWCEMLAARGFHVVRFDNRDIGLSTKLHDHGVPTMWQLFKAQYLKRFDTPAYLLKDMAEDGVQLLDALEIEKAHVVGASMGGMIAQEMAINFTDRLMSLTSIMSTTGGPKLPQPPLGIQWLMVKKPDRNNEKKLIEHGVRLQKAIGSVGQYAPDETAIREFIENNRARSTYMAGSGRQLYAILCSPPRSEALNKIQLPALVIHGAADRLVHPEGGRETAASIPNARLEIINDFGHDLPEKLYEKTSSLITGFAIEHSNLAATSAS